MGPQGHQQSLNDGIILVDSVVLYYPHDNIVGDDSCDERGLSNQLSACHKPLSILWLLDQICL